MISIRSLSSNTNRVSIISARVHPGETLSSHVMESIIAQLLIGP